MFSSFIVLTVSANLVVLALDIYPISLRIEMLEEYLNVLFVFIYCAELVMKLYVNGIKRYFRNKVGFNTMDAIIVLVSIVEVALSASLLWPSRDVTNSILITALRSLRLLRALKLARYWLRFQLILETLGRTLIGIRAFSVIIVLFTYIFTILGLEFFAGKGRFDPNTGAVDMENGVPATFNFETFLNSLFTVFIVLTNDLQSYTFN